jgi:hypothetical protein
MEQSVTNPAYPEDIRRGDIAESPRGEGGRTAGWYVSITANTRIFG